MMHPVVALHAFVAAHAGPPVAPALERAPVSLPRPRMAEQTRGEIAALRAALTAEIARQEAAHG